MKYDDLTTEERNTLIAKHVMQWTPTICEAMAHDIFFQNDGQKVRIWCSKCGFQDREGIPTMRGIHWKHTVPMPRYTESVNDAWMVVEKASAIPTEPWKGELPPNTWFMHYFEEARLWAHSAQEAPEEICIAALRALGILDADGNVEEEA